VWLYICGPHTHIRPYESYFITLNIWLYMYTEKKKNVNYIFFSKIKLKNRWTKISHRHLHMYCKTKRKKKEFSQWGGDQFYKLIRDQNLTVQIVLAAQHIAVKIMQRIWTAKQVSKKIPKKTLFFFLYTIYGHFLKSFLSVCRA
jgi:hypothetical protein